MTTQWFNVTPDPQRITESLRDTGYILNTAMADIMDNSIAAGAKRVSIEFKLDIRGHVRVSILDDGIGMSRDGLINALKYGSDRREDPSSLGKFGLGLKTASTSFAKRLKLTSKTMGSQQAHTAIWDLDKVSEFGWKVEVPENPDAFDLDLLESFAPNGSGTIVRWEKVDRVIRDYVDPAGAHAKKAVNKVVQELSEHLAMVFQRFLDPNDDRAATIELSINGERIRAWNPFAFDADCLLDIPIKVNTGNGVAELKIRAFVLPRKVDLQASLGDQASEAKVQNKMQGIYTYRENRMIHGPDWLNMWIMEPHFTLCRVELSFEHTLDDAFQVDIKKSTIILDPNISAVLVKALTPPRREAEKRAREGQRARVSELGGPTMHGASNAAIEDKSKTIPAASLQGTDEATGMAEIRNDHGVVKVDYVHSVDTKVYIEAVDELRDGILYQPAYIGSNPGVRINKSHPYYEKVYLPNQTLGNTVQALDSLLWALAAAEFRSVQDATKEILEDIRYDVSRALKKLVEDLPAPDLD